MTPPAVDELRELLERPHAVLAGRLLDARLDRRLLARALGAEGQLLQRGGQSTCDERLEIALDELEVEGALARIFQHEVDHLDGVDEAIARLADSVHVDQLRLRRLKKRKLMLKDAMTRIESMLIPDLDA